MSDLMLSTDGKDFKELKCSDKNTFEHQFVMTYKGQFHVFETEDARQLLIQTNDAGDLIVGTKYEIKLT
jgi:hypothetical protein